MKFCENCGAKLEDSTLFCENCGTAVDNNLPVAEKPEEVPEKSDSKTLGILSIVFAFLWPLVGLIVGIVGMKKADSCEDNKKLSKLGVIFSSIFLALYVCAVIFYIFIIIVMAIAVAPVV